MEQQSTSNFPAFKMPSFGASDNQQMGENSGEKKKGLLGIGMLGMGGSRRRRTSRRSLRRKSTKRRRRR